MTIQGGRNNMKAIQVTHCYLIVNIYNLRAEHHSETLADARKLRDMLNKQHVHPAHYPADAKDPYVLVLVKSGEVVK